MNHERDIECPNCHLHMLLKGNWEEGLKIYQEILTPNQVNGRKGGTKPQSPKDEEPVRKRGRPPRSHHQAHEVKERKDMENTFDGVWDDRPLTRPQWDFAKDNQKGGQYTALELAKEMNMPYSQILLTYNSVSYEDFLKSRVEGRISIKEDII